MKGLAAMLAAVAVGAGVSAVGASGSAQHASKLRVFRVTLAGENETPAGDPVATGSATIRVRPGTKRVCYTLTARDLPSRAVAAHIHRGAAGTPGGIVVPLRTPNANGTAKGCARASRALVRSIAAHPSTFYVNVHTAGFPGGAIRGQLAGQRTAVGTLFHLTFTGSGDPNGTGTAILRFRRDAQLVCYRLHVANITLPTIASHIHRGAAGTNGPVLIPLAAPDASGNSSGCAAAPTATIDEILANPAGFYVNVHTKDHPGGAVRAQLG
jgi:hypothetical protein